VRGAGTSTRTSSARPEPHPASYRGRGEGPLGSCRERTRRGGDDLMTGSSGRPNFALLLSYIGLEPRLATAAQARTIAVDSATLRSGGAKIGACQDDVGVREAFGGGGTLARSLPSSRRARPSAAAPDDVASADGAPDVRADRRQPLSTERRRSALRCCEETLAPSCSVGVVCWLRSRVTLSARESVGIEEAVRKRGEHRLASSIEVGVRGS
jgi:hypothetical protein